MQVVTPNGAQLQKFSLEDLGLKDMPEDKCVELVGAAIHDGVLITEVRMSADLDCVLRFGLLR